MPEYGAMGAFLMAERSDIIPAIEVYAGSTPGVPLFSVMKLKFTLASVSYMR